MVNRLEFSKKVKLEIFRRAGGPDAPHCEKCLISVRNKPFEYDHIIEEWERDDVARGLRAPLGAADGQLLCIACHDAKSGKKSGERAHGKRIMEKAAKATKKGRGFYRDPNMKAKIGGGVIDRRTGKPWRHSDAGDS